MKRHSYNLHTLICGIFCPHSVDVDRYTALIWTKSPINYDAQLVESIFQTYSSVVKVAMLSVLIFCHDRREGDFFCKLCTKSVKTIGKDALYSFVTSDIDYDEANIQMVIPPNLIIADIMNSDDLGRVKYIRTLFAEARLFLLSNHQISPEYYLIPEISPDILLLKPYVYLKAVETVHKILLWCYRDRSRKQGKQNLLEMQSGGEVYYFDYGEVHYLEARDKKIVVHMREQEVSFYNSLQKLEKKLPEYFIRCHRSYIVNFMFIQKVDLTNSIFYLNDKTVIPISQKYKVELMKILKNIRIQRPI